MTSAKISKVTISNSNYLGLIVISVELVSCPGFSWTLVTPLSREYNVPVNNSEYKSLHAS